MSVDTSVIAALEAAVASAPSNDALRLHLIDVLAAAHCHAEVLRHTTVILDRTPDHGVALRHAAAACEHLGDSRALAYRRMANAFQDQPDVGQDKKNQAREEKHEDEEDDEIRDEEDDSSAAPLANVVRLSAVPRHDTREIAEVELPKVRLQDVAGLDAVKRRLTISFLAPMRNPEMRAMYGKSLRGGLLLYGPPGCGKTFIARVVAGELGARFISIGIADVLDMYLGQSERNLHELFELARRSAPVVLFFDEIDALGRKRTLIRNSAERGTVNQLLAELDGIGSQNEDVFVLAATNHPWDVDAALRRPGRFDRTLLVLPPDRGARAAIVRMQMRGRNTGPDIDEEWIAAKTEDFSSADVAHLCDSAAELAMEESIETGKARPISPADFKKALREVRPSTRAWFDTARNFAQFANEGGEYDDLVAYMRERRIL